MYTATWGEQPEAESDVPIDTSSLIPMLRQQLKHLMIQFSAQGACVALYDAALNQMKIQVHVRISGTQATLGAGGIKARKTVRLENDSGSLPVAPPSSFSLTRPNSGRVRTGALSAQPPAEEIEDISPVQSTQFAIGNSYPRNHDLIGYTWQRNDAVAIRHDEYLDAFFHGEQMPYQTDIIPTAYLAVPIRELSLEDATQEQKQLGAILGVVVLYQLVPGIGQGFLPRMRGEALFAVERIALHLQNAEQRRRQRQTQEYLRGLQEISATFPTSVNLVLLFEKVYEFVSRVVDISSFLLTLYDRDYHNIYDVFVVREGKRIDVIMDQQLGNKEEERPMWWQVTQAVQPLQFSPANDEEKCEQYKELLSGNWGDQRNAASFLLLPMKMFKRAAGAICITSMRKSVYYPVEIQLLETMVQIVTVSIENEKLYRRDRRSLNDAESREQQLVQNNIKLRESQEQLTEKNAKLQQREYELAALNNTLQALSSMLDLNELLNTFVHTVAQLVQAEICVFFQLTAKQEELVAKAMYAPPGKNNWDDGSSISAKTPLRKKHNDLLEQVRFPFQGTFLEKRVQEEGFIYLNATDLAELASQTNEGGMIFLQMTGIEQMILIPVSYQDDLFGMLAVHTPREARYFQPREVGMLLAICAQAASAIRNAQLFEQREEATAELQRMNMLKDEFLVTASHELRTPLSGILGYASLLKKQSERITAKQVLRFASKIETSAQQLTDLVTSMTEAAKMGALDKKLDLSLAPVQVAWAAEIAANMLSVNIEQQITLHVEQTLWVIADPLRIRQVITNLLDNAAKYAPGTSEITLTATEMLLGDVMQLLPEEEKHHDSADDEYKSVILIRVRDRGDGIPPEDQKKIFEKFVRAPRSLTTPVRGTGLGLFICRRYVEAMSGQLWLESSIPNEGSTFSFYLPSVDGPVKAIEERDESDYE